MSISCHFCAPDWAYIIGRKKREMKSAVVMIRAYFDAHRKGHLEKGGGAHAVTVLCVVLEVSREHLRESI